MSAEATLKMLLLGEDRSATRALKGVGASAKDAEKHTSKLHSTLATAASAATGFAAFEAVKKGAEFLKECTDEAIKNQKAQAVLDQQLQHTAGATKEQTRATEEWLVKQAEATGHTKGELIPEFTKLVTVTHSAGKAQKLMGLAMNVSAGTGKSLKSITDALVKAQNGQVAGLSRLGVKTQTTAKDQAAMQRATIGVDQAQATYNDTVKKYGPTSAQAKIAAEKLTLAHETLGAATQKSKKTTMSFTAIQKELATQFKGDSSKAANTAGGRFDRLKVIWDEAKQTIGDHLLPILTALAGFLVNRAVPAVALMSKWFDANLQPKLKAFWQILQTKVWPIVLKVFGWIMRNKTTMLAFVGTIVAVVAAIKIWTAVQTALDVVLNANPLGLVVIAIAALVAALVYAYKHSERFRDVVKTAWTVIATVARWAWNNILKPIFTMYKTEIEIVIKAFVLLWKGVQAGWRMITSIFQAGIRWVVDHFLGMVGTVLHAAADMLGWVPGVGDKLKRASDAFDRFRDRVNRSLGGIHDQNVNIAVHVPGGATGELNRHHAAVPGVATGGRIRGPGTGTSDSIHARLSDGEFVVNARQTSRNLPLLHAINAGAPGFAGGGLVEHSHTAAAAGWFHRFAGAENTALHAAALAIAAKDRRQMQASAVGLGAGGSGVSRWAPVILQVLKMFGYGRGWVGAGEHRMMVESGGNPYAVNKWDSNWKAGHPSVGLMQVIAGTFGAYAGKYRSKGPFEYGVSVDPLANVYAAVNYALHRYGVPFVSGSQGYKMGGRPKVGQLGIFGHGPEAWVPDVPGTVLTQSQTARAVAGDGASADLTVQLVLDGRVVQQALLKVKRQNGNLSLGLA